jgi:hypothetical protein
MRTEEIFPKSSASVKRPGAQFVSPESEDPARRPRVRGTLTPRLSFNLRRERRRAPAH